MKREGRIPVLRKSRWLLLRRSENLDTDQHFRLRDLLRYNLKTVRAYPSGPPSRSQELRTPD
jgi:transposase